MIEMFKFHFDGLGLVRVFLKRCAFYRSRL